MWRFDIGTFRQRSISCYVGNSTVASALSAGFVANGGLAVSAQFLLSLAMELRAHAEQMSARAETFHDIEVRQKLCGIAEDYEKMAQRLEQHAGSKEAE